jgi:hypothetical protein
MKSDNNNIKPDNNINIYYNDDNNNNKNDSLKRSIGINKSQDTNIKPNINNIPIFYQF